MKQIIRNKNLNLDKMHNVLETHTLPKGIHEKNTNKLITSK